MGQVDHAESRAEATADSAQKHKAADSAWAESLRQIFLQVIGALPDHATLGELVDAARSNPAMAPVLSIFTVQELIDTAKKKPKPRPARNGEHRNADELQFDADGNPVMDLDSGPAVIRRRADVPDGDIRVLRCLADRGPQRESDLANQSSLTSEQLRIILRHLKLKGFIHVEGSGLKRRVKVTRNGSAFLRKQRR